MQIVNFNDSPLTRLRDGDTRVRAVAKRPIKVGIKRFMGFYFYNFDEVRVIEIDYQTSYQLSEFERDVEDLRKIDIVIAKNAYTIKVTKELAKRDYETKIVKAIRRYNVTFSREDLKGEMKNE